MKNLLFEKFNCLIFRDFWMVKIWQYFHKSIWVANFGFFSISLFWKMFLKVIDRLLFLKTLWVFLLGLPNLKNDISYIKYKFSHVFGKVCRWLNMYYSKIKIITLKKLKTMSNWIILKNFVWTYRECNFCQYWDIQSCIHLIVESAS
jgi:hypothetical protein